MKILFCPHVNFDYLGDLLFHGLRSILGPDIVDYPKAERFYKGGPTPGYGKGFTAWNNLEDIEVDRTDIPEKIHRDIFDFVVMPAFPIVTTHGDSQTIERDVQHFLNTFPDMKDRIAIIDGTDGIFQVLDPGTRCLYFKRENTGEQGAFPISFSMPKEKFTPFVRNKVLPFAPYEPGMIYMFDKEEDYLGMYRRSYFGKTTKKAGWDCLRHYEIISQGCIPYFEDIDRCPPQTCTSLPKSLISYATKNAQKLVGTLTADEISEECLAHGYRHCTTEAEAKRFLDILACARRGSI